MNSENKMADVDVIKLLFDPKRVLVLQIASDSPVTVTHIAEKMGEKPSRLYYHVNKLVMAGLLELVETKQQGNLLEKYYKAKTDQLHNYSLDGKFLRDHGSTVLQGIKQIIFPGLKMVERSVEHKVKQKDLLEMTKFPYQAKLITSFQDMTGEKWEQMVDLMRADLEIQQKEAPNQISESKLSPVEKEQKGTYAFVLMSYRVEDAKALGLIESQDQEEV